MSNQFWTRDFWLDGDRLGLDERLVVYAVDRSASDPGGEGYEWVAATDAMFERLGVSSGLHPADVIDILNTLIERRCLELFDGGTRFGFKRPPVQHTIYVSKPDPRPVRKNFDTAKARVLLTERDGAFCRGCETTADLQLDHVYPVAKGGGNSLDNLQFLCGPCNRSKGVKSMAEWLGAKE